MLERNYYGAMMVETGDADCVISGLTRNYPDAIRPALQIIGREDGQLFVVVPFVDDLRHRVAHPIGWLGGTEFIQHQHFSLVNRSQHP